ncbi:MAG: PAS domain S-box protein, partial [Rhodospirillales bacterium]|nr:PAS domain S-box protein [Rhodospirillales bacterium]
FVSDLLLPLGIAGGVLYVVPILITSLIPRKRFVFGFALICSLLTIGGYFLSQPGSAPWIVMVNRGLALLVIWSVALFLMMRVSERKEAAASVKKNQDFLQMILDAVPAGIAYFDTREIFQFANDKYWELLWEKPAHVVGTSIRNALGHGIYEVAGKHAKRALAGETVTFENWIERDGGVRSWVHVTYLPHLGPFSSVRGVIVMVDDITERKERNKWLRLREQEIESAEEGIVTIAKDGHILDANKIFGRRLGYSHEEMLGMKITDVNSNLTEDEWPEYWENVETEKHLTYEANYRRKDGDTFTVEISANHFEFEGEEYLCSFVRDITGRKKIEKSLVDAMQEAEMANRTKSEFLANMSHELRTPLNAVLGFSDALRSGVLGNLDKAKRNEYLDNIHSSGAHLLDLINDILDVSTIEIGKLELNEQRTGVKDIARAAINMVSRRAEDKQIDLISDAGASPAAIFVDERRMKQILVNLLSNAVKFTPENGRISFDARTGEDGAFLFSITDNGIGMTNSEIDEALREFGRVHQDKNFDAEGTGLGLPLAKNLVEAHSGTLGIESMPGKGTTVTVRLPKERVLAN